VLPDDSPVGPKRVGVVLKLILICVEGSKVQKILKQYIGANSWFYNLYMWILVSLYYNLQLLHDDYMKENDDA